MRAIDADELMEKIGIGKDCDECQHNDRKLYCNWKPDVVDICETISTAPTIEPERKKGEWLMDGEKCGELMWRCSECRVSEAVPTATSFISGIAYPQWKFCPNCGAKMEEGDQL